VRQSQIPDTVEFVFEMSVGIHSALALSPGDVSELFVNALMSLDEENRLFPGVTVPEDRLRMASMDPVGYRRPAPSPAQSGMLNPAKLPQDRRELRVRLEEAMEALNATSARQRMLAAKLGASFDRIHYPAPLSEEDRQLAEALLTAAETITSSAEAALRSVL
jgi:hypothetical protein